MLALITTYMPIPTTVPSCLGRLHAPFATLVSSCLTGSCVLATSEADFCFRAVWEGHTHTPHRGEAETSAEPRGHVTKEEELQSLLTERSYTSAAGVPNSAPAKYSKGQKVLLQVGKAWL